MTKSEIYPNTELEWLHSDENRVSGARSLRAHFWWVILTFLLFSMRFAADAAASQTHVASWYGEEHRGRLMANGKRFNPDKLTAASWFYPLGTTVRVTLNASS